jgi:hypothetical protein
MDGNYNSKHSYSVGSTAYKTGWTFKNLKCHQLSEKVFCVFIYSMTGGCNGQERKLESFHKRLSSHLLKASEKNNHDVTHI